ncbi:WD repeat-containing protein PCN-like [Hibiscus syriacus]|uniref:WD repeat-containing protein PCN-like n=1 Tax=Hibiscus syriacus TaxID=106335 RepID=UPI0019239F42|nr:WD repeat-containing protein PCN-like [Hibiscus syriacus]
MTEIYHLPRLGYSWHRVAIWEAVPGTFEQFIGVGEDGVYYKTIHGGSTCRVSSLVWCRVGSKDLSSGRLFSSSIDGSVSEWDLFYLKQKLPYYCARVNWGLTNSVAIACDGVVRIYTISDMDTLNHCPGMPSVTWNHDSNRIYSGSSDGSVVALGSLGSGPELCIWSFISDLLSQLNEHSVAICGVELLLVQTALDLFSSGMVVMGLFSSAHSIHKGDVNVLAAASSQNKVFSAGSDGQVILYMFSSEMLQSDKKESSPEILKKWVFVSSVRAHTHDVRGLTMAVAFSSEGSLSDEAKDFQEDKRKKVKRIRSREKKPLDFSYGKWAHFGVPMLVSAGDDVKLFAYSAKDFTRFSPRDICPAPQRVSIQLVTSTRFNRTSFLLVQASCWLDVLTVQIPDVGSGPYGDPVTTNLVARVKSKACRKIVCSAMSNSGELFGYSDHIRSTLFALSRQAGQSTWTISKRQFPQKLPSAHSMVFTSDGSRLLIAGHDRKIYVSLYPHGFLVLP